MKTIKRANLPEKVNYNGKIYEFNAELSGKYAIGKSTLLPYDAIKVSVLNARLKYKTDLHGNTYKPSEFIFTVKI